MRLARFLTGLMLLAALAACTNSESYVRGKWNEKKLDTDTYNCRWELAHATASNGTFTERTVPEEEMEAKVRQCLEAKGYDFSKPAEEKKDSGWWPW